jgi:hypothetical protein
MATIKSTTTTNVPWYQQPAERPKTNKTFFIYKEHSKILEESYQGNSSALVRLLMDHFFGGKLPEIEEFKNQIQAR